MLVGYARESFAGPYYNRSALVVQPGDRMKDDYFAQLNSWGISGGWEGMTHEEMRTLLQVKARRSAESATHAEPNEEEILRWSPDEVTSRLLEDLFNGLPLNSNDRTRLERLRRIGNHRVLTDKDIEWLAALIWTYKGPMYLHAILGRFWHDRALYKHDAWYLARASSSWRHGGNPKRAIYCVTFDSSKLDHELRSALHTCHAAALNDLGQLISAKQEALLAIELDDEKCFAYRTLGAIYAKSGQYAEMAACYEKADERPPFRAADYDLRRVLETLQGEDRAALGAYLLGIDERKYRWVRGFMKKTT